MHHMHFCPKTDAWNYVTINPSVAVVSKSLSDLVPPDKDIVSDVSKDKVSSPDDGPQAISDVA